MTDPASSAASDGPPPRGPVHFDAPPDLLRPAAVVPSHPNVLRGNILALLVVTLLATHIVLAWASRPPGILMAQDDTEYIVLGQSIREGSYRELFRVDAPVHAQYPPGYPAMLALWGWPFGDDHDALVGLSVLFSAATLLLTFVTTRRLAGDTPAALLLAVLAVNPAMIEMAGGIRSEAAYTLLSMAALHALLKGEEARTRAKPDPAWLMAGVALAFTALFTRTIGITLLAAIGLTWVLQRRYRPAGRLAIVCVMPFLAWLIWTARAPDRFVGSSYIAELGIFLSGGATRPPLPERAVENAIDYATRSGPWHLGLPAVSGTVVDNIVLSAVFGLLLIAGIAAVRRRWPTALAYLGFYCALLVVWLWSIDRFVVPVVPLLAVLLFTGAVHPVWKRVRPARGRNGDAVRDREVHRSQPVVMPVLLAVIMIGGGAYRSVPLAAERLACDRSEAFPDRTCVSAEQAGYLDAIEWVRDRTTPGAILLAAKPGAIYWYTGRKSISFPASLAQDSTRFLSFVRERGATHVLLGRVDDVLEPRLARRLASACEGLRVEGSFETAVVLSLREVGDLTDAAGCAAVRAAVDGVLRQSIY